MSQLMFLLHGVIICELGNSCSLGKIVCQMSIIIRIFATAFES